MQWVSTDSLCKLSQEDTALPAQAFECVLVCVKPAYSMMSQGCWSQEAKARFEQLCLNQELIITVSCCVRERERNGEKREGDRVRDEEGTERRRGIE